MPFNARDLTPMADDALVLVTRIARSLRQKREKKEKSMETKLSEEQKNLLGAVAWGRAEAEKVLQPLKLAYLEGLSVKTAGGAAAWLEKNAGLWDTIKGWFSPATSGEGDPGASPWHPQDAVAQARERRIQGRENSPPRDTRASSVITPAQTLSQYDPATGQADTRNVSPETAWIEGGGISGGRAGDPLWSDRNLAGVSLPTFFRPGSLNDASSVGQSAIPDPLTGTWQTDPLYSVNRLPGSGIGGAVPERGPVGVTEEQESRAPSLRGVGLPTDPAARAAVLEGLTPKTSSLLAYLEGLSVKTAEGAKAWLEKLDRMGIKIAEDPSGPPVRINEPFVPPEGPSQPPELVNEPFVPPYGLGDLGLGSLGESLAGAARGTGRTLLDALRTVIPGYGSSDTGSLRGVGLPDDPIARVDATAGLLPKTSASKTSSLSSAYLAYAETLPAEKRAAFLNIAGRVDTGMNRATAKVLGMMKRALSLEDVQNLMQRHPELTGILAGTSLGAGAGALATRGKSQEKQTKGRLLGMGAGALAGGLGGDIYRMTQGG